MPYIPKPQDIYKHFKGNLYQIITIATHSESEEQMVVYQALYGDYKVYVRPLDMFLEKVDKEKYPLATQENRFELQKSPMAEEEAAVQPTATVQETMAEGQAMAEENGLDPLLEEFLDADSYDQRLQILTGLHHRITNQMLNTMAVVCDIELPDGDVESRYDELRNCLITLGRFEVNRLR